MTAGREGLLEILSWARPHNSVTERRFCKEFLDVVPGMARDGFGNRFLRIGDAPVMWSCHVDTVAAKGGPQALSMDGDVVGLANGKPGMSLGADDGAGIWIMLNMIAARRPGLYLFHRGEEVGCLGSTWIVENDPAAIDGLKVAMAFDRQGFDDVITHQAYGRTCSDAFAKSFADQLNGAIDGFAYVPDDTGVYTDTNTYAGIIPECSNLSVGYAGQHGPRETLNVAHCEKLLEAMLVLDWEKLAVERDPDTQEDDCGWLGGFRKRDTYADAIKANPQVAADLLDMLGIDQDQFLDEVWYSETRDRAGYYPLSAS